MSDWNFDAATVAPWQTTPPVAAPWRPACADNSDAKIAFGIEWAKQPDAFKAALIVLKDEVPASLWVSQNWVKDPIVTANRDAYLKAAKAADKPLTKEELLCKVLAFADEKDMHGRPTVEAKERLNAHKLYAEISGFIGKVDINASTTTINNTNNAMKILLVKPDNKVEEPKVIEASNTKSEMTNEDQLPIKLKLVGGGTR